MIKRLPHRRPLPEPGVEGAAVHGALGRRRGHAPPALDVERRSPAAAARGPVGDRAAARRAGRRAARDRRQAAADAGARLLDVPARLGADQGRPRVDGARAGGAAAAARQHARSTGRSRCRRAPSCAAVAASTCSSSPSRGKLPDEIIDRPKQGFGIPLGRWLRGPLRDRVEEVVARSPVFELGLLGQQEFADLNRDHQRTAATPASRCGRWSCSITGTGATASARGMTRRSARRSPAARARPNASATSGRRTRRCCPNRRGSSNAGSGRRGWRASAASACWTSAAAWGATRTGSSTPAPRRCWRSTSTTAAWRRRAATWRRSPTRASSERSAHELDPADAASAASTASPASACCTTWPIPRPRWRACGAASRPAAICCCGATRRRATG